MTRVLITGANGFAGPYVAAALAARGYEVHGLAREPVSVAVEHISQWHVAELADAEAVAAVVSAAKADAVIHLAAISFVPHSDIADIYASNVVGTRNLLEAISANGRMSGPTVIISSANVYGNRTGGALHEDLPPNPQSDYALSKVACEYLGSMYADRVANFIVRPFNYTGIGQSSAFIIPKIVEHVRKGASNIELGNLNVARDFSDVRYFAECMARLLEKPPVTGEKVNICSGHAYTLMQVLETVQRVSGCSLKVSTNPAFVRANEVERLWGDATKLQGLIGPLQGQTLEETLRWMLDA